MSFIEIENIGPRTIEHWYYERENIDLKPDYQRTSEAWELPDKQLLIDSILNGFDIPKFYFADFTGKYNKLNTKGTKYAVIDGKQRLEAIFGFLDGNFTLSSEFKILADDDASYAGLSYSQIRDKNPRLARKIDGFLITTIGVRTDDRDMITLLFLRLNKGRPLTGAELRNADDSTVNTILRKISNHPVFLEKVKFPITRLQNFDAASKLLLIELNDGFVDTKKRNLDNLHKIEIQKNTSADDSDNKDIDNLDFLYAAEERIITVLDSMRQLNNKDSALSSPGLFPVIYWLVKNNPLKLTEIKKAVDSIQLQIKKKSNDKDIAEFRLNNRNTNDKNSLKARYDKLEEMINA